MEVVKIRLQAQHHSMADPLDVPRYRNAAHAAYTVVREEGFRTLYRGVTLTALRQSTNQAVNFTAYTYFKQWALQYQPTLEELPSYQHMVLGLVSGAMGPLSNAPIDTIKTRLQKSSARPGETALTRIILISRDMFKQEGFRAFYQGITPRVMRVAPGQVSLLGAEGGGEWTLTGPGCYLHGVRVHPRMDGQAGGAREGGRDVPRVGGWELVLGARVLLERVFLQQGGVYLMFDYCRLVSRPLCTVYGSGVFKTGCYSSQENVQGGLKKA